MKILSQFTIFRKLSKSLWLTIIVFVFVTNAIAKCPGGDTKFQVYGGIGPLPLSPSFPPTTADLAGESLNKTVIPLPNDVAIDLDDLPVIIPFYRVNAFTLKYSLNYNKTYYIPENYDGSPLPPGVLESVTSGGIDGRIFEVSPPNKASRLGRLIPYKTQLIDIDITGSGCPSVLFTTSELVLGWVFASQYGDYGNFILGFDSNGNARKMIELDVSYGAKLGSDASDIQVEVADLTGDGVKDLVVRKNGAVIQSFKVAANTYGSSIGIDETNRRSREIVTLTAIWRDFVAKASANDPTAKLYFSALALEKYSGGLLNPAFLPAIAANIKTSELIFVDEKIATYGVVYTSSQGDWLEEIAFVKEAGVWKIAAL